MNPDPYQAPQTPTPSTPPEPNRIGLPPEVEVETEIEATTVPPTVVQPVVPTTPVATPLMQRDVYTAPTEAPALASPTVTSMSQPPMGPAPRSSKKRKLLLIGGPLVAVLLAAGAVFGLVYLPNTPSSVWNTAVNRTGKALDGVVTSATEIKQLESYKSSQVSGNLTATFGETTYSGTLDSKYDDVNSDSGLNITLKSADGTQKIGAQLVTQTTTGSVYPDLYFKISGLKDLGLETMAPDLISYDNRWILASSDYLKSLGSSIVTVDETKQSPLTAADTAEVARAVSKVTREYLFSTSKDKAVFVKKRFVGKENIDSLNTYHYKVGIDTTHAQAYCEAVSTTVINSKAYRKLSGADDAQIAEDKQGVKTSCADNIKDNLKSSDEFDLWVDGKYKLIHKIRQYDKGSTTEYTDLGQNYKGDDELSLFIEHAGTKDKSSTKITLDTNLKTNVTGGTFTYTNGSKDEPMNIKASLTMKPLSDKLQVTKPTDAVPVQEVLSKLGLGDTSTD